VLAPVGWLALLIAASGWILLWLRVSAVALGLWIFCDWTSDCSAILWSNAPFYLATFGLVAPAVPISLALHRHRLGPRYLRAATLVAGITALIVLGVAVVAAYDAMWANYVGPFGLDVPRRSALLPKEIGATSWAAWPALAGAWMALTSVQLVRATVPVAIAGIGLVTGAALAITAPYSAEPLVTEALMPLELILSLTWATSVGVYLLVAGRDGRSPSPPAGTRMSSWAKRPSDRRSPSA
jgi:hypothetical protein